jgi:formylglycine-generating enzyme required for sulfatase activity
VDALAFCARLNEMETKAEMLPENLTYKLPTQGQWESMLGGATLSSAVHSLSAARRNGPSPVATLPANTLGLYDIRGNLWQWCLDPTDKPYRVLRGGAWNEMREANLRPEFRWYSNGPQEKQNIFGFRVVLTTR